MSDQGELDDRKDARKHGRSNGIFIKCLAMTVTLGFFGCLILVFLPLPMGQTDRDLLSMLVGVLVSNWQSVISYFFGSTNSERKKQ